MDTYKRLAAAFWLAVSAIACVVAFSASPAQAEDCETITAEIVDRVDSGLSGNWALDSFTRTAEICDDGYGTFQITGSDTGMFVTTGPTSPGSDAAPLEAGIEGTFSGSWTASVKAGGRDDTFDPDTNEFSTGQWVLKLFTRVERGGLNNDWEWQYQTWCGDAQQEIWVNSAAGNRGDITSKPDCPTPSPGPTPDPSPSPEEPSPTPDEEDLVPGAGGSDNGQLPTTGASYLPVIGIGGAAAVVLGVVWLVLARRKRVTFTA